MLAVHTKAAATTTDPSLEPSVDWKQLVGSAEAFLGSVGDRMREQIREFDPDITPYVEYALADQGKQLRPALVALSARAAGELNDDHITAAVIVEMVHLATLVHDDVIDEASIRRSKPTLAANWGNEISVLLGDCLFAHSLKLAASFPTPEVCRAVAAATNTVCAGEILQTLQRRNLKVSRTEYFKVLRMKTGELFAVSCDLGAFLTTAPDVHRAALRAYGLALGTVYQVYDDCLDLFGSEARVGKSLGTDLAKGKLTLPLLLLLEDTKSSLESEIQEMLADWKPRHLPRILNLLRSHKVLERSWSTVQPFLQTARRALDPLPDSESVAALRGVCDYLARQIAGLRDSS